MTFKVERCLDGGKKHTHRLTMPDGRREVFQVETWDRSASKAALDLLEYVYLVKRRNIRFDVR